MDKKLYLACAGAVSFSMLACSVDNVSGSSEDPNVLTAHNSSSSSVGNVPTHPDLMLSSSSDAQSSSSIQSGRSLSSSEINSSSSADEDGLSNSAESVSSSSQDESPLSSSSMNVSSSSVDRPPVLCKTSYGGGCVISFTGDLWDGLFYYENYGMDVGVAKFAEDPSKLGRDAGKWFWVTDSADGGKSFIEWPEELGNEYSSDALDPVVERCWGICGTAKLDKGNLTYQPFVGVGFNVAGFDSNGVALSADISNWNGFCISYSSRTGAFVELDLGDSLNQKLRNARPVVDLPKSSMGTSKCFEWSDFKMPAWAKGYEYKITGEEAAKHVVRIVFRIQNQPGSYDFSIFAVGTNLD